MRENVHQRPDIKVERTAKKAKNITQLQIKYNVIIVYFLNTKILMEKKIQKKTGATCPKANWKYRE